MPRNKNKSNTMSVTVRILIYLSGNFPSYLTTQLGGINFSTAGTVQNLTHQIGRLFELSSSWWKEPHNVKLVIFFFSGCIDFSRVLKSEIEKMGTQISPCGPKSPNGDPLGHSANLGVPNSVTLPASINRCSLWVVLLMRRRRLGIMCLEHTKP